MRPELSDDAVLGGRLRLLQPRTGHRFGHDAILLAAAVQANAGERALELGSGVGAAGLALAARIAGLSVSLIELNPILAELAQENARRNGLADRVSTHCLDATAPLEAFAAAGLVAGSFDHVLSNPPFNDPARHNASPDPARRGAHLGSDLRSWIASAAQLLRPQGTLTLIYRADGLAEVLDALAGDFGSIAIVPIFPKPNAGAIRVVVRGLKGSRGALTLCPGLLLNEQGRSSRAAELILREGAALSFAA
ncbi:MAG: methyltransferase [Xanthobacteraceae bacterium]|nr:methyltransferase [Xanthobacteraceae bacterium]